jgi:3-hydroxybutyryl-CoA dehydrogenase
MIIIVATDETLKSELVSGGIIETTHVEWVDDADIFSKYPDADAYIDLLFNGQNDFYKTKQKVPVFVNSVNATLNQLPDSVIRINAWPGFLSRNIVEASIADNEVKQIADEIMACFNKKIIWVPDTSGFVSARVIACIINEAYLTLGENVSTKEDIDTAMKLGTNYPFGPFEWSEKIGLKNVFSLLDIFSKQKPGYDVAPSLIKELNN